MKGLIAVLVLLASGVAALTHWGARQAEVRHPPVGRFAQVEGLRIHYTDTGPAEAGGRPLILIHGATTSLLDFQASLVPLLAHRHRVVAVDRAGHGYSERPSNGWPDPAMQARLVHALADRLGLERPILVGHSLAGAVVLAYLLDYPRESGGGVLIAGASHPWQGGVAWYNDLAGVPILGPLFANTLAGSLGRLGMEQGIGAVFDPEPPTPGYRERTGVDLSLRPRTFLANAEDIRRLSPYLELQSQRYPDLVPPLLLITGSADRVVPSWNHRDRLLKQVPHVEAIDLPGAGHALHHTHSARVAKLIEEFAQRVGEGS